VRDFSNWERRGPLSPLPQQERPESRDGSRSRAMDARSESYRGNRRDAPPAWGPGEGRQDGSRPPRREFAERPERPERPERVPTAAEKEVNWRNNMRPDAQVKSPGQSRDGSEAPPSPAPAAALPAGRPKLNLAKRTVSEATDATATPSSTAGDSKASPFGAARPIDTAARERAVEERRQKEKKEAEERAKEEKRAKEAAEKAAAEAAAKEAAKEASAEEAKETSQATSQEAAPSDAASEPKAPVRPREPREPREAPKSRAADSGNWRRSSGEQGAATRGGHPPSGPRRGGGTLPRGPRDAARPPRPNGTGPASQQPQSPITDQAPPTPTVDEDGWTTVTVPSKGRRGQGNRAAV
jgi:translation initiation factor 4B